MDLSTTAQGADVTFTLPEPGTANPDFAQPADAERLEHTAEALRQRGFQVTIAESGDQARQLVLDALPEGAEVHTGLSETLQQIGLTEELENSGRYDPVRARLKQLDRETQGREMRKLGAAPDYVIGSAAAITDDGQIVVGSGSGSQLGAYAYAGGHVILVVGQQKLVRDVAEGLARLQEYSLPREWDRMQAAGYPGTLLAKTLIISYEPGARISVILVPETLGF
jgi:L-lactate utilization protein LutC